jgi:hypothetical protein
MGAAGDDDLLVAVGLDGLIAISDGSGEAAHDYHTWMSAQSLGNGSEAPLQDTNVDGISNLMAYIHGIPAVGVPTSEQRTALPTIVFDAEAASPVITFELREGYRPGVTYSLEVSPDMKPGTWQTLQRYTTGWSGGPDQAVVSESLLPGGGVRITVSNFPHVQTPSICFFRLRALLP